MVAQVRPSYSARNTPRSCSRGTTRSTKGARPLGVMWGTRMKPSAASAWTSSSMASATFSGDPTKDCRPVTSIISPADRQFSGLRLGPPLVRRRQPVPGACGRWPGPGPPCARRSGVDIGQRPVRVVVGQVAVPQLLQEADGGLAADLLPANVAGQLLSLGVGVGQDEGGRRQDLDLVGRPPVSASALDIGVEGPPGFEGAVPAEDGVGGPGRKIPARFGVARLKYDRPALGGPGTLKRPEMSKCPSWCSNDPRRRRPEKTPRSLSATMSRLATSRTAPMWSGGTSRPARIGLPRPGTHPGEILSGEGVP